mmetsp:Transcript_14991/g.25615  ORF Transcript_14991/g.25615 Transcript_14991/m.25615 type:complete len:279 (-) Transcript_14991:342-1178(-)
MPPLNRTIAFPQMNHIALTISNDLNLNVSRTLHEALDKDAPVAKGGEGLGGGRFEEGDEILAIAHDAHSLAAASHGGLEDDGEADLVDEGVDLVGILQRIAARYDGHSGGDGGVTGGGLVREGIEIFHGGTHEGDAGIGAGLGELRTLAEESVARMDGIDAALLGNVDDLGNVEVGADWSGALGLFEEVGFVGAPSMLAVSILVDVDGHGAHVEFGRGALDADGDFGAVGSHDLGEGGRGELRGLHANGFGRGGAAIVIAFLAIGFGLFDGRCHLQCG